MGNYMCFNIIQYMSAFSAGGREADKNALKATIQQFDILTWFEPP